MHSGDTTAGDDLLGGPNLDDLLVVHRGDRRSQVLVTLADILITAGVNGRHFAVVDAGADCAAGFADDLAAMVRGAGTPCARLRDAGDAEDAEDGIVLADGSRWRAQPPQQSWDVTIYLRTPPPRGEGRGASGVQTSDDARRGHGDGEFGADIVIDHHPSGRAVLAARHGRTLRDDEPLAPNQLRQLLDGSGWSLVRYDDPPHRFYALAERSGVATQSRLAEHATPTTRLPARTGAETSAAAAVRCGPT